MTEHWNTAIVFVLLAGFVTSSPVPAVDGTGKFESFPDIFGLVSFYKMLLFFPYFTSCFYFPLSFDSLS